MLARDFIQVLHILSLTPAGGFMSAGAGGKQTSNQRRLAHSSRSYFGEEAVCCVRETPAGWAKGSALQQLLSRFAVNQKTCSTRRDAVFVMRRSAKFEKGATLEEDPLTIRIIIKQSL